MTRTLVLRPSAKINLTLTVGAARDDGFHPVRTVLQSISLCDRLTFTVRRGPFELTSSSPDVPVDRTNLIWKAAQLLWTELGRVGELRGIRIELDKRIPVAAGLGGGSADAAATLAGLHALWRGRLAPRDLAALAGRLGSDVPFFLQGGTALGLGRGEELYPLADVRRFGVVVIKPDFGVSAGQAYRWWDEDTASRVRSAVRRQDLDLGWPQGALSLNNDLESPVARRYPAINEMVAACFKAGATVAAMTGSGSAVFGVFSSRDLPRAVRRLARPGWTAIAARTLSGGEGRRRLGL